MTTAGWLFMICSNVFVVGLVTFCFWRVLSKPQVADHVYAPLEIDTHDYEE